jgi:hypothetical protein
LALALLSNKLQKDSRNWFAYPKYLYMLPR